MSATDELFEEDSINAINIAPLVDVCLVLLLVYMVTMPLSSLYAIAVKDQALSHYGLTTQQDHVVVHLTSGGPFIEDAKKKEQAIAPNDFSTVLTQMILTSRTHDVLLKVDRDVPHGQTVTVMDVSKAQGASSISIFEGEE